MQIVSHIVHWEDVHIDTNLVTLSFLLNHTRTEVYDLCKGVVVMGLCQRIDGPVDAFGIVIALQELLVVLAWHIDVDIVVPWDIALMAHSPYQRSTRQEIAQAVSLTVLMHLVEDAHLNLAQFVYVCNLFHNL